MMVAGRIDTAPASVISLGYMNIDAENKWFLSRMELGCVIASLFPHSVVRAARTWHLSAGLKIPAIPSWIKHK